MITMRSADLATFIRVGLVLIIVYLVLTGFNPLVSILLFAVALILDGVDGYLALLESSKGRITPSKYIKALTGNSVLMKQVKEAKLKTAKLAPYGPRLDIIGDRIIEYTLYILFTFVHIIPLFVLLVIVIRNCAADGLMGLRGTSSKMKSRFARIMYASAPSRAAANILKFLTFSYLMLQYVAGYPAIIGQALVAILVIFSVLRGASEIYESLQN
jgi:phosphatidylglycerophosphate synthase